MIVNQFDSSQYPTQEPRTIAAGTRWAWKRPDITKVYPTDSYTLEYRLCLQESSHDDETFQASKIDSEHVVELSSATTTDYASGLYVWQAVIIRDSDDEEVVVSDGFIEVEPDLGAASGDTRGFIYRTLQAIRATLEGTATKEQKSYEIAGRKLERRSPKELMVMEAVFSQRWNSVRQATELKNNRAGKKSVVTELSGR